MSFDEQLEEAWQEGYYDGCLEGEEERLKNVFAHMIKICEEEGHETCAGMDVREFISQIKEELKK